MKDVLKLLRYNTGNDKKAFVETTVSKLSKRCG